MFSLKSVSTYREDILWTAGIARSIRSMAFECEVIFRILGRHVLDCDATLNAAKSKTNRLWSNSRCLAVDKNADTAMLHKHKKLMQFTL